MRPRRTRPIVSRPAGSPLRSSSSVSARSTIASNCCAVRGQLHGLFGEPDAAAPPFEQNRPGLPLQLGDLLRHRRRRVAERGGGGADGAVHGDGVQRAQPLEIEHGGPPGRACGGAWGIHQRC